MRHLTQEHKDKISVSMKRVKTGVPLSEEHKAAQSKAALKRKRMNCKKCSRPIAINNIAKHEAACWGTNETTDATDNDGHTRSLQG